MHGQEYDISLYQCTSSHAVDGWNEKATRGDSVRGGWHAASRRECHCSLALVRCVGMICRCATGGSSSCKHHRSLNALHYIFFPSSPRPRMGRYMNSGSTESQRHGKPLWARGSKAGRWQLVACKDPIALTRSSAFTRFRSRSLCVVASGVSSVDGEGEGSGGDAD